MRHLSLDYSSRLPRGKLFFLSAASFVTLNLVLCLILCSVTLDDIEKMRLRLYLGLEEIGCPDLEGGREKRGRGGNWDKWRVKGKSEERPILRSGHFSVVSAALWPVPSWSERVKFPFPDNYLIRPFGTVIYHHGDPFLCIMATLRCPRPYLGLFALVISHCTVIQFL